MPTVTSEREIFAKLEEQLRLAAEDCALLAWHPRRGFVYDRFRKALKEIEGCCRQAYYWRNYDGRWLKLGWLCGEIHKRAGHWLRNSQTVALRKAVHPMFGRLATILQAMHADAAKIRTAATGRLGPILPAVQAGPHRDTRPVQVLSPDITRETSGGIILPAGVVDARRAG